MQTIVLLNLETLQNFQSFSDSRIFIPAGLYQTGLEYCHTNKIDLDLKSFEESTFTFLQTHRPQKVYLDRSQYLELLSQDDSSEVLAGYTALHELGSVILHSHDKEPIDSAKNQTVEEKKLISVVVPIYFEEVLLEELNRRMLKVLQGLDKRYDYELIYVNDGSTDSSLKLLKQFSGLNPKIKIVDLSRNFGHQIAITAGMDLATGDAVIVIDGDLQDPPEVITEMVKKWEEGYQVVYGLRKAREGETAFKLWTARVFYNLMHKIAEVRIPQNVGDFRLMDRIVLQNLNRLREQNRYIRGMVSWLGFKTFPLEYERDARFAGETKYSLPRMVRLAFDGITGFSDKPLYLSGYIGIAMSGIAVLLALRVFFSWLAGGEGLVQGWASVMIAIFVIGGVQLICLAVMGQYIGRIYRETRGRPLYAINELTNFKKP